MCSEDGARSGLSTVLVYVELLIDNGLGRGVHGPQGSGSEPSLGEGPDKFLEEGIDGKLSDINVINVFL